VITKSAPQYRRRRGRKSATNFDRDNWIFIVIESLPAEGVLPTRNRETQTPYCGCSIVVEALAEINVNLSEAAVEKVWENWQSFREAHR
jgi:hypothetical protein